MLLVILLRGSGCSLLREQGLLHLSELAKLLWPHFRVAEAERVEGIDDGGGDDEPREPLVVGRHDVPGRLFGRGLSDHVLVRPHVVLPALALLRVCLLYTSDAAA